MIYTVQSKATAFIDLFGGGNSGGGCMFLPFSLYRTHHSQGDSSEYETSWKSVVIFFMCTKLILLTYLVVVILVVVACFFHFLFTELIIVRGIVLNT